MENYNHNCLVFATHKLDEGIGQSLAFWILLCFSIS